MKKPKNLNWSTTFRPVGQRLSFSVDWPLPGMATWHEQPTPDDPWVIRREELFLDDASLKLDEWLGQQIVISTVKGSRLRIS